MDNIYFMVYGIVAFIFICILLAYETYTEDELDYFTIVLAVLWPLTIIILFLGGLGYAIYNLTIKVLTFIDKKREDNKNEQF